MIKISIDNEFKCNIEIYTFKQILEMLEEKIKFNDELFLNNENLGKVRSFGHNNEDYIELKTDKYNEITFTKHIQSKIDYIEFSDRVFTFICEDLKRNNKCPNIFYPFDHIKSCKNCMKDNLKKISKNTIEMDKDLKWL